VRRFAGCVTIMVLVSPKFGDSEHSFILSKKLRPASTPFYFKSTMLPPAFICFGRFHIVDAILRRVFYAIHIWMLF
jgi:hypothetical protein